MVTVAAKGHLLTVLLGQRIRFKDLIQMKRSGHLPFLTVEASDSKMTDIGDKMCLTVLDQNFWSLRLSLPSFGRQHQKMVTIIMEKTFFSDLC